MSIMSEMTLVSRKLAIARSKQAKAHVCHKRVYKDPLASKGY